MLSSLASVSNSSADAIRRGAMSCLSAICFTNTAKFHHRRWGVGGVVSYRLLEFGMRAVQQPFLELLYWCYKLAITAARKLRILEKHVTCGFDPARSINVSSRSLYGGKSRFGSQFLPLRCFNRGAGRWPYVPHLIFSTYFDQQIGSWYWFANSSSPVITIFNLISSHQR